MKDSLQHRAIPLALATCTVVIVAGLLALDAEEVFAQRPVIFKQGQGDSCRCVLGVVFPSVVAEGVKYGTCGWDRENAKDPVGWAPFEDEDRLWVRARCEPVNADVEPVTPPENPWGAETTPSEEPWFEDEEWLVPPSPDAPGDEKEVWEQPGQDGTICPCTIYIKWTWVDDNGNTQELTKEKGCYKEWHKV
ncbi:MAG: hypothetical protein K8I27_16955 [Planctomycetes bacterium]|nr:hypothetical protein [Planctomycetota bacterium]